MKVGRRKILSAVVAALAVAWVVPLQASGLLDYAGDAYNDGTGPGTNGTWYGVATYSNNNLQGTVDYVVFTSTEFAQLFPASSGYVPTPKELVYAYQINCTGPSDTSTLNLSINDTNPADNPGSFTATDITGPLPTEAAIQPEDHNGYSHAYWYVGSGVLTGDSSAGLVFSSPDGPEMQFASLINSGLSTLSYPLPAPSASPATGVPEPATVILLAAAAIVLGLRRRLFCKQA